MTKETAIAIFISFVMCIGYIKYSLSHLEINGYRLRSSGMMEYTNPQDQRKLYVLIYEKVNK